MNTGISITGIVEIDAVLRGLPKELQHKILSQAHADAAEPLVNTAQSIVPEKTGNLQRSIGIKKFSVEKAGAIGLVQAGPLRGGQKKGFHGHLIEYGHRIVTRSGAEKGRTTPKPFMKPAWERTKGLVERGIAEAIGRRIRSFMRRTIKNNA